MNQADHGIQPKLRGERPSVCAGWIRWCGCAGVVCSHQLRESGSFNESARYICVHFRDAPPLISEVKVEPHHPGDTLSRLTQPPKFLSQRFRKTQLLLEISAPHQFAFSIGEFAT